MAWFTRQKPAREPGVAADASTVRTEGLWLKCDSCRQVIWRKALEDNLQVCPKCEFHFKIDAAARLRTFFDQNPTNATVSFISGPSRTGDIHMRLTLGVHGPETTHAVVVR